MPASPFHLFPFSPTACGLLSLLRLWARIDPPRFSTKTETPPLLSTETPPEPERENHQTCELPRPKGGRSKYPSGFE